MIWTWIACQVQCPLTFDGASDIKPKLLSGSSHLALIQDRA